MRRETFVLLAVLAVVCLAWARPVPAQQAVWTPLIDRLTAEGLDRAELTALFASPQVSFDPSIMAHKVDRMVRKQFEPRPAPSRRTLAQSSYAQFLKPWVLAWANDYARTNREALLAAQARFGVPPDIVVALILVETKLGTYLGEQQAFPVLASLAASDDLARIRPYLKTVGNSPERAAFAAQSAKDRAEWAYQELKALILYAKSLGQNPLGIPGSIYGAIGICQFMPTNIQKFAVDVKGAGTPDLFRHDDAIMSVASYLWGHGWRGSLDYEGQKAVVYAYNHSDLYALAVMTVAESLRRARGEEPAVQTSRSGGQ